MDIIDNLFLQRDDSRRADQSNEEATHEVAASTSVPAPPGVGSLLPTVALPHGFLLTYSYTVKPNTAPLTVTLTSATVGRLVFTILDTAAGLAIGSANEWQPSARWLEKQAMEARGEPWPYVQPEDWHPSRGFRAVVDPLAAGELPACMIVSVQGVMGEAFAGSHGFNEGRVRLAEDLLPAVVAPIACATPRIRRVHPDGEGTGFVAVVGSADGRGEVSAHLPCPTPSLQYMASLIANNVAALAVHGSPSDAAMAMSEISAGVLPDSLRKLLVGLVVMAAGACNMCSEHRRRYLVDQRAFDDPLLLAVNIK